MRGACKILLTIKKGSAAAGLLQGFRFSLYTMTGAGVSGVVESGGVSPQNISKIEKGLVCSLYH